MNRSIHSVSGWVKGIETSETRKKLEKACEDNHAPTLNVCLLKMLPGDITLWPIDATCPVKILIYMVKSPISVEPSKFECF